MNFSQRMTEEPFYEQQAFSVPQWDQDVVTTTFKTQKITKGNFPLLAWQTRSLNHWAEKWIVAHKNTYFW